MKKTKPCRVCGSMTSELLFNNKRLDIAMCSRKCQYEYLGSCTSKDQANMLRYLDREIEKVRWRKKIGWMIAASGVLIVATGFFTSQAAVFIVGAVPLTVGALSTTAFESEIENLTKLRKRVSI